MLRMAGHPIFVDTIHNKKTYCGINFLVIQNFFVYLSTEVLVVFNQIQYDCEIEHNCGYMPLSDSYCNS